MKLLYISEYQFLQKDNMTFGSVYACDIFFEKYLDVFDSVRVLGETPKKYVNTSNFIPMTNRHIEVKLIEPNTYPHQLKNDFIVKRKLKDEIKNAEAILIKPDTRKGIMAVRMAKKLNKPYMIDITGDIYSALRQKSAVKRMYAPYLYWRIKRAIKDCEFGLYVSEHYLQKRHPIKGLMEGISDVVIEKISDKVLEKRKERIHNMKDGQQINLALVGSYHDSRKGIDTAILALSDLNSCYHLNILSSGIEEDRKRWIEFGKRLGVTGRIHFPSPVNSTEEVLNWLDTQDIFVLPSRSEGLPRALVEAISRGCPCIAANFGSASELIEREWIHDIGDYKKLTSLISDLTSNKNTMLEVACMNFENSKKYEYVSIQKRRNLFLGEFKKYCESKAGINPKG